MTLPLSTTGETVCLGRSHSLELCVQSVRRLAVEWFLGNRWMEDESP